ncbi:hypothetical protein Hanom_Chr06g00572621 [Helianthus anomalus]
MGSDYRLGLVKRKNLFSQGCFFIYFNLSQQFFSYYLILYLTMILCMTESTSRVNRYIPANHVFV